MTVDAPVQCPGVPLSDDNMGPQAKFCIEEVESGCCCWQRRGDPLEVHIFPLGSHDKQPVLCCN